MNAWSINKHSRIKLLLLTLQTDYGPDSFFIDNEFDNDFSAITLFKPGQEDVRAYVHIHGQTIDNYGLHLEYPSIAEQNNYDSTLIFEELSLNLVIDSLVTHFEIDVYDPVD